jgi:serine/threonine-protein kinase
MSETNSLNSLDQTTNTARPRDPNAIPALDAAGHALFERIGVGGMGEVYRCGDDGLGRDLAIKVLKPELHSDADAAGRFLREARLTGSLQHPGVVPVHQLGRLADGRPCYTMKLVRGRTLADLLREEADGPERLPRLLAVVEKVCQAVAFAHSRGVIHRDLKPSNVMVGEFGEVQVMDWGLAKELARGEPAVSPGEVTEEVETVGRMEEAAGLSRAGAALGTPSYMPPEQAAGDWDIVDERADVFALGAVLCQVLTGRPPYHGANRDDLLRRARRGDVTEALGRLEQCGADTALVNLCHDCLAAERERRPRQAGVVAERLASYQAEVRERLRQAERARAEVQALEQSKRRRLAAALALAALLLLSGGALVWWQGRLRQAEADGAVAVAMGEARLLHQQAQADSLSAAAYDKAVAAAQKTGDMARASGASEEMQRQADDLLAAVRRQAEEAENDRRLLARLLEARGPRGPREGPKYSQDDQGTMMAMAEPTAEEQFASAFRDWGLDVDAVPTAEAAARLKARPSAVVTELIAALDEWTSQRRVDKKPATAWRRVAELAAALDDQPGSMRSELREILARNRLPVERALDVLSAASRPVPLPLEVPLGPDRARLRQLAERIDPAKEPVLGLLTLTRALRVAGEEALAERLLHTAIQARPREVVLYHTLGLLLQEQEPPRWSAAVECYAAARALRPDLGAKLAMALLHSGRAREGLALLARMVQERPTNPYLRFQQSAALGIQGKSAAQEAACRKAIALQPGHDGAYVNLGVALNRQGKYAEAEAAYHQAIALQPDLAGAYVNLGIALNRQGKPVEAEAAYRQAIALQPDHALAHCNLGGVLARQGRFAESLAARRRGHELGSKQPAWSYPSLQWVQEAERLVELEKKLPSILQGETSPANASDAVTLAWMCRQPYKKQHVAAARLYADAFTADPKLASDMNQHYCYYAACSAALAAAGQGEGARLLPDKVVTMLRHWALGWLHNHLMAYAKIAERNDPAENKMIQQKLAYWHRDPDLASVRDRAALDRLADNERAAWQALWRDVDELAKRVAK